MSDLTKNLPVVVVTENDIKERKGTVYFSTIDDAESFDSSAGAIDLSGDNPTTVKQDGNLIELDFEIEKMIRGEK